MLRALVLLLLLANAGFWAWREGWLGPLNAVIGARPEGDREPGRLALQLHPERVQTVALAASAAASAAEPPPPPVCLEAGPFEPKAVAEVQAAVQALLPPDSLSLRTLDGGWWIVMGPYPEARLLGKKKDELRQRGLEAEEASLGPTGIKVLQLSRHNSRELADAEMVVLAGKRVRTARVVDATEMALRVAQADAALQQQLSALPEEPLAGKRFEPCPAEAAAAP